MLVQVATLLILLSNEAHCQDLPLRPGKREYTQERDMEEQRGVVDGQSKAMIEDAFYTREQQLSKQAGINDAIDVSYLNNDRQMIARNDHQMIEHRMIGKHDGRRELTEGQVGHQTDGQAMYEEYKRTLTAEQKDGVFSPMAAAFLKRRAAFLKRRAGDEDERRDMMRRNANEVNQRTLLRKETNDDIKERSLMRRSADDAMKERTLMKRLRTMLAKREEMKLRKLADVLTQQKRELVKELTRLIQ